MGAWIYLRPVGIAIAACVLLMGCGQSGPLYIPGNPSKIENPPPADDQAEEEKEEEDNDSG